MQRKLIVPTLALLAACGSSKDSNGGIDPVVVPCDAATALTLAVGDVKVLTGNEKASVCINGGAGGEYALIPVYTADSIRLKKSLTFTAEGTSALATGVALDRAATDAISSLGAGGSTFTRDAGFDARLRAREHALFVEQAGAARTAYDARQVRRGGASYSVAASAAPAVGSLITLNANSESACNSPDMRVGRVMAVTNNAVVVADTTNPANGFTTADFQSIGVQFDTLAYVVDTLNFGKPADIDANGDRVVIFFTKAVNDLTPANSESYVGGFFFGRDLYPLTDQGGLGGCKGSNYGELFYTLVPDAVRAGTNANSPFAKDNVKRLTVAVLAHEFQHLINLSRRLYVTRTSDEVTWLNEGLSHVAEELVFYRSSGLTPRQNITSTPIRTDVRVNSAYNQFESSNFGRLLQYLPRTETSSPTADNDSLETRGATWQLLRYAADRKGGTERDTWYSLVNSNTRGLPNLVNVFGSAAFGGTRPWMRDWAVTNFTNDAGFPVPAEYTDKSWNYRDVVAAVNSGKYPLKTHALLPSAPVTVSLVGGAGVAYMRFGVASGGRGSVAVTTSTGTAFPAGVDMVLVRSK
jgi:hypothetical protein